MTFGLENENTDVRVKNMVVPSLMPFVYHIDVAATGPGKVYMQSMSFYKFKTAVQQTVVKDGREGTVGTVIIEEFLGSRKPATTGF